MSGKKTGKLFSTECQGRKLFCLPKRQDEQNKCCVEPSCHSDTLPCALSVPCYFSVAIVLFTLFSSSACNRCSLFCIGCSQSSELYKIMYFYFLNRANKELSNTGSAQCFRTPPAAPAVCWLCCSMGMSV